MFQLRSALSRYSGGVRDAPARIGSRLVAMDDYDWSAVSLVSTADKFKLGDLARYNPRSAKDRLRKQFDRSDIADAVVMGGIDFDVQIGQGALPLWRPHFYLLVKANPDSCREALQRHFPQDSQTLRPIRVRRVIKSEAIKPATYTLKATFKERPPFSHPHGNALNRAQPLRDDHWRELAPLLDKWGVVARLVQRNTEVSSDE